MAASPLSLSLSLFLSFSLSAVFSNFSVPPTPPSPPTNKMPPPLHLPSTPQVKKDGGSVFPAFFNSKKQLVFSTSTTLKKGKPVGVTASREKNAKYIVFDRHDRSLKLCDSKGNPLDQDEREQFEESSNESVSEKDDDSSFEGSSIPEKDDSSSSSSSFTKNGGRKKKPLKGGNAKELLTPTRPHSNSRGGRTSSTKIMKARKAKAGVSKAANTGNAETSTTKRKLLSSCSSSSLGKKPKVVKASQDPAIDTRGSKKAWTPKVGSSPVAPLQNRSLNDTVASIILTTSTKRSTENKRGDWRVAGALDY